MAHHGGHAFEPVGTQVPELRGVDIGSEIRVPDLDAFFRTEGFVKALNQGLAPGFGNMRKKDQRAVGLAFSGHFPNSVGKKRLPSSADGDRKCHYSRLLARFR